MFRSFKVRLGIVAAGEILKKHTVFRLFWKLLAKKSFFLARAPPAKLVALSPFFGALSPFFGALSPFFGARSPLKGAFRKNLCRSVSQKLISQNSTKGDSLGRQGVKSLREGVRYPPPPPQPP